MNPTAPSLHDHLQSQSALHSLENGLSQALLIGGIAAAAVVVAPVAIPALGIGGGVAAALAEECCTIVGINTGITGALTKLIDGIPVIGSYLSTAGGKNMLVPAVTILGGQAAGSLIGQVEQALGRKGRVGAFVRATSLGVGVVLSLPAVLPGIGHGVQFLSRLAGADGFGVAVAQFLGNSASCTSVATTNGIMGGTSALAAHLPCAIPAVVASFPMLSLARVPGRKSLPPDDPNRRLTSEQEALVAVYNGAAPAQKIILQKQLRDLGFNPDFHDDGTVHLFQHAHSR